MFYESGQCDKCAKVVEAFPKRYRVVFVDSTPEIELQFGEAICAPKRSVKQQGAYCNSRC